MDVSGPAFPTESQIPRSSRDTPAAPASTGGEFHAFGKDGFSFWDLLDIVNPLQHLPGVSILYRRITGDEIDPLPRVAGGVLFGGMVGAISSLANVVVKEGTGRDIGGNVLALVEDGLGISDDTPSETGMMVAAGPSVGAGTAEVSAMAAADPTAMETMPASAPADAEAMVAAAGPPASDPSPASDFGLSWKAAFRSDFYDAESFDPKRGLIQEPPPIRPAVTVADAGEATAPDVQAAASAHYALATERVQPTSGSRLNLVG